MKHVRDFLIETLILTVAVIGWGIMKASQAVQGRKDE